MKTARSVAKQEARARQELIPPGTYRAKLISCIVSPKVDKNKNYYWIWQFEITEDDYKGTKLRTNTGLDESQQWALERMFDAFEVKPNVDTETLIGKEIKILVDQLPMTGGPRAGQLRNDIIEPMPLTAGEDSDDDDWDDKDEDADKKDGDDEDDDDF